MALCALVRIGCLRSASAEFAHDVCDPFAGGAENLLLEDLPGYHSTHPAVIRERSFALPVTVTWSGAHDNEWGEDMQFVRPDEHDEDLFAQSNEVALSVTVTQLQAAYNKYDELPTLQVYYYVVSRARIHCICVLTMLLLLPSGPIELP